MIDIPQALQERYNKPNLSYSSLKVALTDMAKFDQYMKGELKFQSHALTFARERRAALIANGKGDPFNLFVRF